MKKRFLSILLCLMLLLSLMPMGAFAGDSYSFVCLPKGVGDITVSAGEGVGEAVKDAFVQYCKANNKSGRFLLIDYVADFQGHDDYHKWIITIQGDEVKESDNGRSFLNDILYEVNNQTNEWWINGTYTPAERYGVSVNRIQVTSANTDNILGDYGTPTAAFDPKTSTLTLNNYSGDRILAEMPLNIVLADGTTNSIDSESGYPGIRMLYGGTISGKGDLTVKSDQDGIESDVGGITISGSGDVTIEADKSGIWTTEDLVLSGSGDVTIEAGESGIWGYKGVVLSGSGAVTVTAGEEAVLIDNSGCSLLLEGTGSPISLTSGDEYTPAVWNREDSNSPVGGKKLAGYNVNGAPDEQSVEYTQKIPITEVTVLNFESPIPGKTTDELSNLQIPKDVHYKLDPDFPGNFGYWYNEESEYGYLEKDVTFTTGEDYQEGAWLVADDGYYFADNCTFKAIGADNAEKTLDTMSTFVDEKDITKANIWAAYETAGTPITEVTVLNFESPLLGKTTGELSNLQIPKDVHYKFDPDFPDIFGYWYDEESEYGYLEKDVTFTTGKDYQEGAWLVADDGYYFADNCSFKAIGTDNAEKSLDTMSTFVDEKDITKANIWAACETAVTPIPPTYTVSFNMNGHGNQVTDQTVNEGDKATKPADPTAEGWIFAGWYADDSFSTAFDFTAVISADTTVYAKWTDSLTINYDGDNIILSDGKGGLAPQNAAPGENIEFSAEAISGYKVKSVTVTTDGGKSVDVTDQGSGVYSFVMPDDNVTVKAEAESDGGDGQITKITPGTTSLTLKPGKTDTIKYTVEPTGATETVTFESSDPAVITVDDKGEVTAVGLGTATITIKSASGKAMAKVTVTVDPFLYRMIKGDGQIVMQDAANATFSSEADYGKFVAVEVDGKELGSGDFDSYSGSTIIKLKAAFIRKLGLGIHTIRIISKDGYAMCKFTIKDLPDTGDSSMTLLWTGCLVLALGGIVMLTRKRKVAR